MKKILLIALLFISSLSFGQTIRLSQIEPIQGTVIKSTGETANKILTTNGSGGASWQAQLSIADYIQNQNAAAQTANMWISGQVRAANIYSGRYDGGVGLDINGGSSALFGSNIAQFRNSTDDVVAAVNGLGRISGRDFLSTVPTGTAPLTVASNFLVSNLNADLLDGQHGSYYQSAINGLGYVMANGTIISYEPNVVTNSGTSTDNYVTRFDGTTGKIIQNSSVTIDDNGIIYQPIYLRSGASKYSYFGNVQYNTDAAYMSYNTNWSPAGWSAGSGGGYFLRIDGSAFSFVKSATVTPPWASHTYLFTVSTAGAGAFTSTVQATTAKLTNLTDGFIPYHISAASGLSNSIIKQVSSRLLVGTTTDNTVDKLQVSGTVTHSDATLTTQSATLGQVQSAVSGLQPINGIGYVKANGATLSYDQNVITNLSTSTDNNIARFDGTTGKIIQNSLANIDDAGVFNATGITNVYQKRLVGRNNLGNPTVEEQALFHGQFNNKLRFISPFIQEESVDGITWTPSTRGSADVLGNMMRGEGEGTNFSAIPAPTIGSPGAAYRLTWDASQTGYVFLNSLYVYNSTNGNTVNFKIEKYHNTTGWSEEMNTSLGNWPGHVYLPHNSIYFSSSPSQFGQVRITFQIVTASYANAFSLYGIEWFGGYPAGKRNVESFDRYKNVTFPANILTNSNIGIGTAFPGEKLEVVGKTKTTTLQVTTGAFNGYFMKSDASGNGTWSDLSTIYEPKITPGTAFDYIRGDKTIRQLTTNAVPENINLYFTDARARAAFSLTTNGTSGVATYDPATGAWNIPNYASGLTDPMTTRGDIIYRNSSNVTARLPLGQSGQILTSNGLDLYYSTPTPPSIYLLPLAANGTRGGLQIGYVSSDNDFALKLSSEKGYVSLPDASTTTRGIASFATSNFTTSYGYVSIKTAGITADNLTNGTVGFGKLSTYNVASDGKVLAYSSGVNSLSWIDITGLPSQATHSGKYLTTNGTTASWATVSGNQWADHTYGIYYNTNGVGIGTTPGGIYELTVGGTWSLDVAGYADFGLEMTTNGVMGTYYDGDTFYANDYFNTPGWVRGAWYKLPYQTTNPVVVTSEGSLFSKTDKKIYFKNDADVVFDLTNVVEPFRSISANTTLAATDKIVLVTTGGITITYPTITAGKVYTIRNATSTAIIVPSYTKVGSSIISTSIVGYACVSFVYSGTAWFQIN